MPHRQSGCAELVVSKSVERCLSFFQTLRQLKNFQWTEECQQAFKELKKYIGSTLLFSKLRIDEKLYLYVVVSPTAISAVLIHEQDKIQRPIYYVSRVLHDAETRYTRLEKLIFALIIAVRRLRPYF